MTVAAAAATLTIAAAVTAALVATTVALHRDWHRNRFYLVV